MKESASEVTTSRNMPKCFHPYGRAQFFRKKGQIFRIDVAGKHTRLPVAATVPKEPVQTTPIIPASTNRMRRKWSRGFGGERLDCLFITGRKSLQMQTFRND